MQETAKIWMNGELVDWADATVHVGVHGLHYGTGVFEGIRAYETPRGPGRVPARGPHAASPRQRAPPVHGAAVLRRGPADGDARPRARQRAARGVHPADRLLRLRLARRAHARQPGRDGDHELAVGRLSRRGLAHEGHHRQGLVLEAGRPERHPARLEGDRDLPQLDAGDDGGAARRLRRGDPADGQRLRRGRAGREHLRRQGRPDPDAAALDVDPPGHHAGQRHRDRPRPRVRRGGEPT